MIEELKSGADDKALYRSGWQLNTCVVLEITCLLVEWKRISKIAHSSAGKNLGGCQFESVGGLRWRVGGGKIVGCWCVYET